MQPLFSLHPQCKKCKPGYSLPLLSCASLEEGLMQLKWNCSYPFECGCSQLCTQVLQHLNWILEFSSQYFGPYIVVKLKFLWGKEHWDFPFSHLVISLLPCFSWALPYICLSESSFTAFLGWKTLFPSSQHLLLVQTLFGILLGRPGPSFTAVGRIYIYPI